MLMKQETIDIPKKIENFGDGKTRKIIKLLVTKCENDFICKDYKYNCDKCPIVKKSIELFGVDCISI